MESLRDYLQRQEKRYLDLQKRVETLLADLPEGRLEVAYRSHGLRFYLVGDRTDGKRTYLGKKDMDLVKGLLSKRYLRKLKRLVDSRLRQLQSINRTYRDNEIEGVYMDFDPRLHPYINPLEDTRAQKMKAWLDLKHEARDFTNDRHQIFSKRGERMRSKSEKILADRFDDYKIPYKYEYPLVLSGRKVYPDFTFFHPTGNQQIYWEHFGIMDDPSYCDSTLRKIELYNHNGIYIGENLIVTFETAGYNLNDRLVEGYIRRYLLACRL